MDGVGCGLSPGRYRMSFHLTAEGAILPKFSADPGRQEATRHRSEGRVEALSRRLGRCSGGRDLEPSAGRGHRYGKFTSRRIAVRTPLARALEHPEVQRQNKMSSGAEVSGTGAALEVYGLCGEEQLLQEIQQATGWQPHSVRRFRTSQHAQAGSHSAFDRSRGRCPGRCPREGLQLLGCPTPAVGWAVTTKCTIRQRSCTNLKLQ